jgi:formylglycine-generating enzyme required for sulfatase activity
MKIITAFILLFIYSFSSYLYEQNKDIINTVDMKFKLIKAGTFIMGADDGGPIGQSKPAHKVTITHNFFLGIYEVTQAQYEKIMGENPSTFKGDDLPVAGISYKKAEEFCRRLSEKENVVYRLPYEAEWEYSYRAGSAARYPWGDDVNLADEYGWHEGNSSNHPHPVGLKKPNKWGLYDMSGNVQEFVKDIYGLYKPEAVIDPKGALKPWGELDATLRSGSYDLDRVLFESCFRHGIKKDPDNKMVTVGFRVVREIK